MKILFDYRMATWSGIGRYSRSLARALHKRDDIELCLIAMTGNILPDDFCDLQIIQADKHPLSAGGFRELRNAAAKVKPDVVHCTHITTPNLKGVMRSDGRTPPIVTTMHDLTPLLIDDVMSSLMKRAAYSGLNQRSLNWSKAVITPSEHTKSDIERFFPRAVSEGLITVIPLAADELLNVEPTRPATMECLNPQFQANFLLSMGNTKAHKDIPTLLKAFERLARSHLDLALILVGDEPAGYLKQQLPADLQDRVQFSGALSDENLVWLYQRARALVFPSRYEGFGLPPLEAMSFGCPVIVADAASLPEVVGDAGVLVAAGDVDGFTEAIDQVLSDDSYATKLEDCGLARAQQFSWSKTAEQTVAVYKSVL